MRIDSCRCIVDDQKNRSDINELIYLRRIFIAFHDDRQTDRRTEREREKKTYVSEIDELFPRRLSIVNAVFEGFRSLLIVRMEFDTGGTIGRDRGGIKGKYRLFGRNGKGNGINVGDDDDDDELR